LERSGVIAQAVLTKIYRQGIPELREAIGDLSKGRTGEGFDKLDKFGAIQEIADDADRLAALAQFATARVANCNVLVFSIPSSGFKSGRSGFTNEGALPFLGRPK